MRAGARSATIAWLMRYLLVVDGRLSQRFAAGLEGVTAEARGATTALSAEVGSAAELDSLLARLGDLGLELTSLSQVEPP
jgi:hypothetical protein